MKSIYMIELIIMSLCAATLSGVLFYKFAL